MNPPEPTPSGTRQNEAPANETPRPPPPQPPRPPPVTPPQLQQISKKVPKATLHGLHIRSKSPFFKTLAIKIKNVFRKHRKFRKNTEDSLNDDSGHSLFELSDRSSYNEGPLQENLEQQSSNVENKKKVDRITLFQEYRLVERPEKEINAAWKGAHLILFFLTFVFGSFCTFCFHVLMYMFDEKCVLSPKMVAIKDMKRSNPTGIIIDYIAARDYESMPVEFVTTIWVDKSYCYLPTYVPLLSGICGLVWTTMFLMSSSGTQTLSGLQRPWRVVPAVFVFSTIMSILCIYTSVTTHKGLLDLCYRLAEVFGSDTCSYTINVATISYERRIRGVYQATRLTMAAAWLHTLCWVSAALVALARVLFIIDFRLVRVRADLIGNVELMLERHEKLIRTNEYWNEAETADAKQKSPESIKVHFVNKGFGTESQAKEEPNEPTKNDSEQILDNDKPRSLLKKYYTKFSRSSSENSFFISSENIEGHKVKRSESEKTLTYRLGSDDTLLNIKDKKSARNEVSSTSPGRSFTSEIIEQWMPKLIEKLSSLKSYVQSAALEGASSAPLETSVSNEKEKLNEIDTQGGKKDAVSTAPLRPYVLSIPGPSQTNGNSTPSWSYDLSIPGPSQSKDNSTPSRPYDLSIPGPAQTNDSSTPSRPFDDLSIPGPSQTKDNLSLQDMDTVSFSVSQKMEKKKEKQD